MPINRFYIDQSLVKGNQVDLQDVQLHHIKVMRLHIGDSVELINGKNTIATAQIIFLDKEKATCSITTVTTMTSSERKVLLFQALPKINRLDIIVEKTIELGVHEIIFFPGDFSEKKNLSPSLLSRLQAIALSAIKQCGRLDLPIIRFISSLDQCLPQGEVYFGDTDKNAFLFHHLLTQNTKSSPISIFIGPEKGFSPKELQFLQTNLKATGIKLNKNILRTETAAISALAIAMHY